MTESEKEALRYKDLGNKSFKENKFEDAIQFYSNALELTPKNHILHSNRCAAYLKLERYEDALHDAESCISIDPRFIKGHARKGNALFGLNRFKEASAAFEEALKIDISNESVKKDYVAARKKLWETGTEDEDIPVNLVPTPACDIRYSQTGVRCVFHLYEDDESRTVLLRHLIEQSAGIYRWTVNIKYNEEEYYYSTFAVGAIAEDCLEKRFAPFPLGSGCGQSSFCFSCREGELTSLLCGVEETKHKLDETDLEVSQPIVRTSVSVPDGAAVTVEVDTTARTLSFFVNGEKIPCAFSGVHLPLFLAVSGFNGSFTSDSFRRLRTPTPSPVACVFHECRPKDKSTHGITWT